MKKPAGGRPSRHRARARRAREVGAAGRRDQNESAFAAILGALLSRVPGARGAALVDREGETVDYAGWLDPYDLRVTAAHLRIVVDQVASLGGVGAVERLVIRASRRSFLVQVLPEGYALVVALVRTAGFAGHSRALPVCARALGNEAGWVWPPEASPASWFPLDVVADARRRPSAVRLAGREQRLEILGAVVGTLTRRERAWRVRLESGIEATLVREPGPPARLGGGCWYSDEPVDEPVVPAFGRRESGKMPRLTSHTAGTPGGPPGAVTLAAASPSSTADASSPKKTLTGRPR